MIDALSSRVAGRLMDDVLDELGFHGSLEEILRALTRTSVDTELLFFLLLSIFVMVSIWPATCPMPLPGYDSNRAPGHER